MGHDSACCTPVSTLGTASREQRSHIPSYRGRSTPPLNRGIIGNILCFVLLLGTAGDTEIHKTVPAPRLPVILLEEKTCTCKMSLEKKVALDPESQKVVPAVLARAPEPAHLARMALPAGAFDL